VAFWARLTGVCVAASISLFSASSPAAEPDPEDWHPLRLVLEEFFILGLGSAYYFAQHKANSQDWTYDYSWSTLQAKIVGDGYSFDTNQFATNTISHSTAGTFYYLAARGNSLSPLPSLAAGFFSSALWELLGEFRERVSINDQLVTPFGGFAYGETLTQAGRLFKRGCGSFFPTLGTLLTPFESTHRWVDGGQEQPRHNCNAYGLSSADDYHLQISVGPSFSGILSRNEQRAWLWSYLDLQTLNVPRDQTAAEPWRGFRDGGLSQIKLRVQAAAEGLHELELTTRASLFGSAYRDMVSGTQGILALGLGAVYSQRRYGASEVQLDPLFVLEAPALFTQWRHTIGNQRIEFSLVAGSAFAEVGSFALLRYLAQHSAETLTPVVARHAYSHAFGVTLSPEVRWSSPLHELVVQGRVDRLWTVNSKIGDELASSDVKGEEVRRHLRTGIAVGSDPHIRFAAEFEVAQRRGTLGDVERNRVELTGATGIELQF
jgi:hypothetical protein